MGIRGKTQCPFLMTSETCGFILKGSQCRHFIKGAFLQLTGPDPHFVKQSFLKAGVLVAIAKGFDQLCYSGLCCL